MSTSTQDTRQSKLLESYQGRDKYYNEIRARDQRAQSVLGRRKRSEKEQQLRLERLRSQGPHNAASIFGLGYAGYGNGWTEGKARILYPKERKRPRRHLREVAFAQDILVAAADANEILVPIRLDLDFDKYKLRDTFVWNLNENLIPVELFAEHLCEDFSLPFSGFVADIEKSVKSQLAEHHPHKFPDQLEGNSVESTLQSPSRYTDSRDDDLRISVKLDITVGSSNLIDQFEWDLNNSQNEAEHFANNLTLELGLVKEFRTAIAHAIREQCQLYTKSLFLVGHTFDGTAVEDADMKQMIMPPVYATLRPKHFLDRFAPCLHELNTDQLERIDKEREREGRRNRRQTRGKRGANLPDLNDLPKTYRTPYFHSVLVSEDESQRDRHGVLRTSVNPMREPDDFSDEEDNAEKYLSDRASRAARSTRGANTPRQTTSINTPMNHSSISTGRDRSQRAPISSAVPLMSASPSARNSSAYDSLSRAQNSHLSGKSQTARLSEQDLNLQRSSSIPFNPSRESTTEPQPSLIVRLKIPRLRQFLRQQHSFGHTGLNRNHEKRVSDDVSAKSHSAPNSEIPRAIMDHLINLQEQFPHDRFEPVLKQNHDNPMEGPAVRVRCSSCPGVLYFVNDFDVHLRNRQHRRRVEESMY